MKKEGIIFDGDDTLWETQSLFENAKRQFWKQMRKLGFSKEEVIQKLEEIDHHNIDQFAFSKARFPLSMQQTYEELCKIHDLPEIREQKEVIRKIGSSVFSQVPSVFKGVKRVLQKLHNEYFLILATKGDKEIQEEKLRATKLEALFDKIYILNKKTEREYHAILEENNTECFRMWVVGNSVRSDINPALKLRLKCFWIPRKTWSYEEEPLLKSGWVQRLSSIKQLPKALRKAKLEEKKKGIKNTNSPQKIVYLFSSAYHKLYKQDVLDVLALPHNFRHHFRYDKDWIAKEILEGPRRIIGMTGVVVFVDRAISGEEERDPFFYPVRNVTIIDSVMEGSTIHVYFRLGNYIDYPMEKIAQVYNEGVKNVLDEQNRPFLKISRDHKEISGKFIGLGTLCSFLQPAVTERQQSTAWQNIIRMFEDGCPDTFKDAIFYRLTKIEHLVKPFLIIRACRFVKELVRRGNKESFKIAQQHIYKTEYKNIGICDTFLPPHTGYILKGGGFYRINLSFYRKNPPSGGMQDAILDINFEPTLFHKSFTTPIRISFRYDYKNVDLATKEQLSSSFTKIIIGLREKDREKFASPYLTIPMYLVSPHLKLILLPLLFLMGSAFIAISGSDLTIPQWAKSLLLVFGPIMQTFSLWIMYRKLK